MRQRAMLMPVAVIFVVVLALLTLSMVMAVVLIVVAMVMGVPQWFMDMKMGMLIPKKNDERGGEQHGCANLYKRQ